MYNADSPTPPVEFSLPIGLIAFKVLGVQSEEIVLVTLILPEGSNYTSYIKYGRTPEKTTEHWFEFTFNGTTGFLLDENVAAIQYLDGQLGDGDLEANGIIEELGGPAGLASSAVEGWDLYQ